MTRQAASATNFFALLIGVSSYHPQSGTPPLRGCVHDVHEMQRLLIERFAVPPTNILTLTDDQATHAAIVDAIQSHLVAHAVSAAQRGETHSAFLFYFSGHGSQTRDLTGQEPDGMDETIVPYDSRTPGVFDIRDWELGQMVDALSAASENITVILDCCHSGSGTRKPDSFAPTPRGCPPDLRSQPSYRSPARRHRALSNAGWELGSRHALIAACRDRELANEMAITDGKETTWRGALSYFLQQELQRINPEVQLTNRELVERVRTQVTQHFSGQTPQCEGDIDRLFLGGLRPQQDRFFTVLEERAGLVWIDGGVAHGVRNAAQLAVYPPETRTLADAGAPLDRLEVVEEGGARSGCRRVVGGDNSLLLARAALEQAGVGSLRRTVRLAVDDAALKTALTARLSPSGGGAGVDVSPYVRVVTAPADFIVTLRSGRLEILDAAGVRLCAPRRADEVDRIALDLVHMARYRNALELTNDAPSSPLAGLVSLEFQRLVIDPEAPRPSSTPIPPQPGGEIVIQTGERIVLALSNRARQPLYIGVFAFLENFEIVKLFPREVGAQEALPAGRTLWLGRSLRKSDQYEAYLPPGVNESRDCFKVIASVSEVNFDLLPQEALGAPFTAAKSPVGAAAQPPSALDALLAMTTGFPLSKEAALPSADAWTTVEATVYTVAHRAATTRPLVGGATTTWPGFTCSLAAPPGCDGQARVFTQRQAQLGADSNAVAFGAPSGLAPFPEHFQLLTIAPAVPTAPAGIFIEIEIDEAARRSVTPVAPLVLELGSPLGKNVAGVLALAHVGGAYFPVGRNAGRDGSVTVEWLPRSPALLSGDGANRAIQLILYAVRKPGRPLRGLYAARFLSVDQSRTTPPAQGETERMTAGGVLRYRRLAAPEFAPGQHIALALPDAGAEPDAFVACLTGQPFYDHVLTFVGDAQEGLLAQARRLRSALRRVQLDGNAGINMDIFGLGAGGLVARALVELLDGDAFVARCFLVGTPNLGTPLAASPGWNPWRLAAALNQVHAAPPFLPYTWVTAGAPEAGPADLRPTARLLKQLNQVRRSIRTAYFLLAGNHSAETDRAWFRFAGKVGDPATEDAAMRLQEQNDLFVPLSSAATLGATLSPRKVQGVCVVPCNHFAYLDHKEAQAQLWAWITRQPNHTD